MAYPEGETAFCLGVSCALFLFILIVVLAYARSVLRRPAELAYDAGVRRYSADRRRTTHGQGWGGARNKNRKIILTKKTNASKLYNWYIKVKNTLMLT